MSQAPDIALPPSDHTLDQVRREWRDGAAAWRRWRRQWQQQSRAATDQILRAAGLRAGMHVLDLASGSGEPALSAAEEVGPTGSVVATDLVPEMMDGLEEEARARGLHHLIVKQADMQQLPFHDRSFDAVTARFAIVFCPDVDRALGEIRRVLRRGGRAAFIVWGRRDQPYFQVTAGIFARHVGRLPRDPGEPDPFAFAVPGSLSARLQAAGFRDPVEQTVILPWTFPGPAAETWQARREISAPLFHRLFDALPRDRHEAVNQEIVEAMRQHEMDGEVRMTAEVVCASATV
jgi:SAM-dependent methyltransferase